jgi:hypothetical protein
MAGEVKLEPARQFTACQHDPAAAAAAFQADIRTETDNRPFIGTTRVRLAEAQMIV